ncbi:hypothetical protein CC80DRAFT_318955 [Byssothecium circinans]|uniref:Uncharacterized protein n=1 Tax=Byssothecium circinans TaxID=147558 RepID=A0A6A5U527_9PLEO|nr:hypothetical protein CC80DRAFT_318955 [Byssothecium circinans]
MPASTPTPRVIPTDFLRARQWRDEHQHLSQRVNSHEATLNSLKHGTEKAARASATAVSEVAQLKEELDGPLQKEKDMRISRILKEHDEELADLKKSSNSWRPMFQSCQDGIIQVERAAEQKMEQLEGALSRTDTMTKGLSGRLVAIEKQLRLFNSFGNQVTTMQLELESMRKACSTQAAEITHLKQTLRDTQHNPHGIQSGRSHIEVPRSPPLPGQYFASSTLPPASGYQAADRPKGRQHSSPTVHPTSDYQIADERQNLRQPTHTAYQVAQGVTTGNQYFQEAQIIESIEQPLTETQATTQIDVDERDLSSVATDYLDEMSSPRKKQKMSLDSEAERLRRMMQSQEDYNQSKRPATQNVGTKAMMSSALQATQRVEPAKSSEPHGKAPVRPAPAKSNPRKKQRAPAKSNARQKQPGREKPRQGPPNVSNQISQRATRRNPKGEFMSLSLRRSTVKQMSMARKEATPPRQAPATDSASTVASPTHEMDKPDQNF